MILSSPRPTVDQCRGAGEPDLFSGMFNVARNPVNKSPRALLLAPARRPVKVAARRPVDRRGAPGAMRHPGAPPSSPCPAGSVTPAMPDPATGSTTLRESGMPLCQVNHARDRFADPDRATADPRAALAGHDPDAPATTRRPGR